MLLGEESMLCAMALSGLDSLNLLDIYLQLSFPDIAQIQTLAFLLHH